MFFKQRDHHFYTAAAFTLNGAALRIPEHLLNATVWSIMVYFSVGFYQDAGRCGCGPYVCRARRASRAATRTTT